MDPIPWITVEFTAGASLDDAERQAARLANTLNVGVRFDFNGQWYYKHPDPLLKEGL